MGAQLCCFADSVPKSMKKRPRRPLASNEIQQTTRSLPRKRQVRKDLCKVTLEDLIAASPTFNIGATFEGECKETGYRVDIVSMRREKKGSVELETPSYSEHRKLTKKVSFRSPPVADIVVLSPVLYG